jgi:glycosyl transferase family 87
LAVLKRLVIRLAVLAACLIGALELWGLATTLSPPAVYAKDFGQEYLLARVMIDGGDPYVAIATLAERYTGVQGYFDKTIPTPHPPTVGLLLLPLGWLDYASAARVWFVAQVASLAGCVYLLPRVAGFSLHFLQLLALGLLLVAWQPVLLDLGLGQVTLPLVFLLAASEWALVRERRSWSGVLLGLSMLVKPLAWPWLLVLAHRGEWRVAGTAIATVAVGYALVALRLGPGVVWDYVTRVLPQLSASYALEPTNISLWTLGPRVVGTTSIVATIISICAVGALLVVLWMRSGRNIRPGVAFALAAAISVIVSPISWVFYLVLTLVAVAGVVGELRRLKWPRNLLILSVIVGVCLSPYLPTWTALAATAPLLGLAPAIAVLMLIGLLLRLERARVG